MFTNTMLMSAAAGAPSNILATDFSGYTLGVQPGDWTRRWDTAGAWTVEANQSQQGGRSLEWGGSGTANRSLSWDILDGSDDLETLMLARAGSTSGIQLRTILRGGGTTGFPVGYEWGLVSTGFRIYDFGSNTQLATDSFSWSAGNWYWVRARAEGNALQGKVWLYGTAEPGSWTISTTNSALTAGWVGVGTRTPTGAKYFDYFAASLDGSTVPVP